MSARQDPTCEEMERLLAERASGPLEPAEAAALERHLPTCARCGDAAAQWQALFSLVALPPPSLREEAVLRDLSDRTLSAWTRRERRGRTLWAATAAAALLAAASLPLVLARTPQLAVQASSGDRDLAQAEWTAPSAWELDEPDAVQASGDDGTLLDVLALEGDGAFGVGDSG
jgi:anti-sigma factor RsiW